jgi:hypothetical protein
MNGEYFYSFSFPFTTWITCGRSSSLWIIISNRDVQHQMERKKKDMKIPGSMKSDSFVPWLLCFPILRPWCNFCHRPGMNEEMNIDELENFDVSFAGVEWESEGGGERTFVELKEEKAFENTLSESSMVGTSIVQRWTSERLFVVNGFQRQLLLWSNPTEFSPSTHWELKIHCNKHSHPPSFPEAIPRFSNKMSFDSSHPKFPSIFIEFSFLYD